MADIEEIIDTYFNDPATGLIGEDAFWKKNREAFQKDGITRKQVAWYFANKGLVGKKREVFGRPHLLAGVYFYQADLMFYEGTIIFCAISMRSRRAYAYCISDKSAKSTTDALQRLIMDTMRAGIPGTIMTDSGKEFDNELFNAVCEKFAIGHELVPPTDHDRLGIVERFNKTLRRRIYLYAAGHGDKWQDQLTEIVHGYNTTVHSITGTAPEYTPEEVEHPHKYVLHNLAIEEAIKQNYKPGTKVRVITKPKLFGKGSEEYSNDVYEVVKQNKYTVVIRGPKGDEHKTTIDKLKRVALLAKAKPVAPAPKPVVGDDIYTADRIVAHKVTKDGKVMYRVKWEGYPMSEATWEPVQNVRATSAPNKLSTIEKAYIKGLPQEVWEHLKKHLSYDANV